MKAAVFTAPNTIEYVRDYPEPQLNEGFLLRVRASGICGTDIKALTGTRPGMQPPMVLGHELAGEIIQSAIPDFSAGERVSVAPYAGCGTCRFCLAGREDQCRNKTMLSGGAFAEKVAAPALLAVKTAWKIPTDISFEEAALAEPLACVVFSLKTCRWEPGWSILVVRSGTVGSCTNRRLGAACDHHRGGRPGSGRVGHHRCQAGRSGASFWRIAQGQETLNFRVCDSLSIDFTGGYLRIPDIGLPPGGGYDRAREGEPETVDHHTHASGPGQYGFCKSQIG